MDYDGCRIFFDSNGKEILPFSHVLVVSLTPIIVLLIYWGVNLFFLT